MCFFLYPIISDFSYEHSPYFCFSRSLMIPLRSGSMGFSFPRIIHLIVFFKCKLKYLCRPTILCLLWRHCGGQTDVSQSVEAYQLLFTDPPPLIYSRSLRSCQSKTDLTNRIPCTALLGHFPEPLYQPTRTDIFPLYLSELRKGIISMKHFVTPQMNHR